VLGKRVVFTPLQPYAVDPNDGNNADGRLDLGNSSYACSPANTGFEGWDKFYDLIDSMGCAAATPTACSASQQAAQTCTAPVTAACGSPDPATGITIEEVDMQNEVELEATPILGRMIYDNTNINPSTGTLGVPVFQYLGGALAKHGYNAGAVTVSVDVPRPANTDPSITQYPYPCGSIYGDAAQMLDSSELLAATGGAPIGAPFGYAVNGEMQCGGTTNDTNPNDQQNPLPAMFPIPSQPTPTVTDMHAKPCLITPGAGCNPSVDATVVAQDIFSMAWDFLAYRGLTGNTLIFGETWSNSQAQCNGYPDGPTSSNPVGLTQETVNGYAQSCLFGQSAYPACLVDGAQSQFGYNTNPASVVFRPWANMEVSSSVCETPLKIGAPNGPFKQ